MWASTLGQLNSTGYQPISIKDELRRNLRSRLQKGEPILAGILGFENTVIPDLERAILSRHHVLFLGLRGQAKTRMARLLVNLLDEYIPIVAGSELNDDPMQPLSRFARDLVAEMGDETPVTWLHRSDRYVEKLATPDVSIADLIGDVDPIKAATLKLPYADERVIHFGLIPRSHRCIFVINELPDLQPRIQVALFNILQEGDIQIRGFKLRLPLDISFVFTANPEDYTNRGSIITPLKDRIQSQILTHYPKTIDIARQITLAEAKIAPEMENVVKVPDILSYLLEDIAFQARESEFVDAKSGVSARLSISAYENLVSTVERRLLLNKESTGIARVSDFWGIIPAITGKIELVYEGEQEGPQAVAMALFGKAIKNYFLKLFPNPDALSKGNERDPYGTLKAYFSDANVLELPLDLSENEYLKRLEKVAGLKKLAEKYAGTEKENTLILMELIIHALAEFNLLSRDPLDNGISFKDQLSDVF
ncbi:MAG: magnesium chelatase [Bacteroidota bacterium]